MSRAPLGYADAPERTLWAQERGEFEAEIEKLDETIEHLREAVREQAEKLAGLVHKDTHTVLFDDIRSIADRLLALTKPKGER